VRPECLPSCLVPEVISHTRSRRASSFLKSAAEQHRFALSLRSPTASMPGRGFLRARQARFHPLSRRAFPARMSRTDFCHPDCRDENPHLVCSRDFERRALGHDAPPLARTRGRPWFHATMNASVDRCWSVDPRGTGEPETREAWAFSSHGDSAIEPLMSLSSTSCGPRGCGLRLTHAAPRSIRWRLCSSKPRKKTEPAADAAS
jgi:hypothetical protein